MNDGPDGSAGDDSAEADLQAALVRFGAAVRRMRESAGMTQGAAAEATGISQPFWSKLERATEEPSLGLALRIVRLFQLDSIEMLFGPAATGALMGVRRSE